MISYSQNLRCYAVYQAESYQRACVYIYRGNTVMLKSFGSTLTTMPFEEKINRYPIPKLLATFVTDD